LGQKTLFLRNSFRETTVPMFSLSTLPTTNGNILKKDNVFTKYMFHIIFTYQDEANI